MGQISTGVDTGDATRTFGVIEHIATGASGAFASSAPADVLITTVGKLAPQYRNADTCWLMNRGTAAALRKLKDGNESYLWQPSTQAGMPDSLLGFRVVIDDSMPDIAADSLSIALGDFRQAYCVVRGGGMRLLRDELTVKGSTLFYAFARVGGALVDDRAVKLVKFAAS